MTYARRFACLILGLAVLMAHPVHADDKVRVDVPDGYKYACHKDTDCQSISVTCDADTVRCCEYDTLTATRSNDFNLMKVKVCPQTSGYTHVYQCTMCEPDSLHLSACENNKCVYTGSNMSAADKRPTSKSQGPAQTQSSKAPPDQSQPDQTQPDTNQ